jgi:tetratricopeptide (TPR) repeat protein
MCNRFRYFASFAWENLRAVLRLAPLLAGAGLALAEGALSRGDALEAAGRHREALEVFLILNRESPVDAEILRRIARQYDRLSLAADSPAEKKTHLTDALEAAQRAVKADPENSQARLCLAIVYGRLAQQAPPRRQIELSKLIKEEAEAAVQLDPRNDIAWHVLGRWNFEMASVNPVLRGLAQVVYGKFPDASAARAEECFLKAIAAGPPRVMHHAEYGLFLVAQGRKNDARKQLKIALSLSAKNPEDEETQERARRALATLR